MKKHRYSWAISNCPYKIYQPLCAFCYLDFVFKQSVIQTALLITIVIILIVYLGGRITRDLKLAATDPRELSPVALAFIGDGVFELLVRERLLEKGSMPAHKLHRLTVKKVCAASQAKTFTLLEAALNEEELSILKRGRNANTSRVPKSCTPEEYRKATAIESLFGYLYLKGEMGRISELFAIVESL